MNAHNTGWLKSGAEAKALVAKEHHKTTGVPPPGQIDDDETLSKLPVWQRTSTTLAATYVYQTGGAVLAKSNVDDKALPRVEDWEKILKEIDWHKHGFVSRFLRNVIFWHHRSTNGRFNEKLGRFERWAVQSVEAWFNYDCKVPNPHYAHYVKKNNEEDLPVKLQATPKKLSKRMLGRASFFRYKSRLIEMGLIEAESHLRINPDHGIVKELKAEGKLKGSVPPMSVTALWIRPTEELCRIMFEPGYWEKVRGKYAHVKTKKKPRGLSAKLKNEALVFQK